MQVPTLNEKWKLDDRPGHLVKRLSRHMSRYAEIRMQRLGTGVAGYPVLHKLAQAGEMTQKQLTEYLNVEQSSTAQLLARLERDGLVERRKDPTDKRSSLIRLTQKATEALPEIARIMDEGNDLAVKGMSEAEVEAAVSYLKRMIANFET